MAGYLWVTASAFLYGCLVVFSKFIYGFGVAPLTLLVINGTAATVSLWIMAFFFGKRHWQLKKGVWRHMLLQGAAGAFITSMGFFLALKYIDASIAILILFVHPVVVLLFEILFDKKSLRPCHLIALGLCIAGLVIVVDPFPFSELNLSLPGFLLAVTACCGLAFNNWYGEKNILRSSPFAVMLWTTTTQAVMFVLFSPSSISKGLSIPPGYLMIIIILALLTWVAPNFLILKGIEAIGASHASLISSLEVVFTMILAFFILQEHIGLWHGIGAALIIVSILFLPHGEKEPMPPANPL
jgi:drug/metabolite transporter (DMT)-like permease